jgi:hypothetical protein
MSRLCRVYQGRYSKKSCRIRVYYVPSSFSILIVFIYNSVWFVGVGAGRKGSEVRDKANPRRRL